MIPELKHMVELEETTHTYYYPGDREIQLLPVTRFVKQFSRPFNADEEAAKYAVKNRLRKAAVLQQWAEKRDRAATVGTAVHLAAEAAAYQLTHHGHIDDSTAWRPDTEGYIEGVLGFYGEHIEAGLAGPVAELRVAHPHYGIAGTVDLITCLDGVPAILDWKTSERIDLFGFGGKDMYAPFNKLPDSNFWHYAIQLNTYRYILKEVYDYEVEKLGIIWLPGDGTFQLKEVLILEDLVVKALKKHERKVRNDGNKGKQGSDEELQGV